MKCKLLGFPILIFLIFLFYSESMNAQPKSKRLIALTYYGFDGTNFYKTDSTAYTYSGKRGGYLNEYNLTDDSMHYDMSFAARQKTIRTYTSSDQISKETFLRWDTWTKSWLTYYTKTFYYDANDKVSFMMSEVLSSTSGLLTKSELFTYSNDGLGNKISEALQKWDQTTANWKNSSRSLWYYDTKNNISEVKQQYWNDTLMDWVVNKIYTFEYDLARNMTATNFWYWDKVDVKWKVNEIISMKYNSGNKVLQRIEKILTTTGWQDKYIYEMGYDAYNNYIYVEHKNWNDTKAKSISVTKAFFRYDAENRMIFDSTLQSKDGLIWRNEGIRCYEYGVAGAYKRTIFCGWNPVLAKFDTSNRYTMDFTPEHLYKEYTSEVKNALGLWEYLKGSSCKSYYYYEEYATELKETSLNSGALSLFPVPCNTVLNINLKLQQPQTFSISLYDLKGRLYQFSTYEKSSFYQDAIKTDELESGLYFIVVQGANEKIARQFTVAH